MKRQVFRFFALAALLGSVALPAACASLDNEYDEITAERIARPAFMVERRLESGGMDFQLWERMHKRYAPANIYIEGDGQPTYLNRDVSEDPTPDNPVALHLASRDNADNLVYISRPCQFRESPDTKVCSDKLWSTRRFGPEVIAAYNQAIDEIKLRYDITEFNLIGYDGGANIAAVIATTREDVASLRTVAGDLNPAVVLPQTGQVLDADNLKAPDIAPALAKTPQHHFVGAGDEVTPPSVYHSFRQAMGDSECVHYSLVQDADHERGWVEKWPELLKAPIDCPPPYVPVELPPVPKHISKDGPNK
ncbi:MAG: hypothetical protein DI551_06565 [Micavibrio aeruginosavorus]|uniref:Alpha/beta hydrolase n=1 Tax=Micavibrio aeruginosavorus TaxID=349221 RepID=A0A2W5MZE5_9BACT|nr:MAG: hypothetical protein DI551_06565 [Micavibrio aeruginosavorus]